MLDDLLNRMKARAILQPDHALRKDMISLSHASFVLRCPAGQILRFLEAGELPGSYINTTEIGLAGLRISHRELFAAIRRQQRADLTLEEVRKRLALSSREIRKVVSAGLLRVERRRPNGFHNAAEFVTCDDYEGFLERLQTPKTAAQHLGLTPRQVMALVRASQLSSVISESDVRVYDRENILSL
ncbi:hypothetical protein [Sagittula stellata]|nr:hypothetical protein [Sagittula stellata]